MIVKLDALSAIVPLGVTPARRSQRVAEKARAVGADAAVRDGVDMVKILADLLDRFDAGSGRAA